VDFVTAVFCKYHEMALVLRGIPRIFIGRFQTVPIGFYYLYYK